MEITSELGKTLDAVSDKVFVRALIISLLFTNPAYFIPLVLECSIAGINIYKDIKDKNPESHMIGKVKSEIPLFINCYKFYEFVY